MGWNLNISADKKLIIPNNGSRTETKIRTTTQEHRNTYVGRWMPMIQDYILGFIFYKYLSKNGFMPTKYLTQTRRIDFSKLKDT
jgi:hypothetical protein